MRKLLMFVSACFVLLIFTGNVCADTVNVGWGTVYSYNTVSHGSESVAQFNLKFNDSGFNTYGFCVAPTITINPVNYNYNFLDWTEDYLQAAWLMDRYAQTKDIINTKDETIGIQSAIWTALTNDVGYAPKNGKNGYNEYTSWYGSLPSSIDDTLALYLMQNYKILNNVNSSNKVFQTLIIKYPSTVPVPAAVWFLGSGLVGLVGFRRRVNKL